VNEIWIKHTLSCTGYETFVSPEDYAYMTIKVILCIFFD